MGQPISTSNGIAARRASGIASAIVIAATLAVIVLLAGAAALWARYGTTVFFELIKSGIAACI